MVMVHSFSKKNSLGAPSIKAWKRPTQHLNSVAVRASSGRPHLNATVLIQMIQDVLQVFWSDHFLIADRMWWILPDTHWKSKRDIYTKTVTTGIDNRMHQKASDCWLYIIFKSAQKNLRIFEILQESSDSEVPSRDVTSNSISLSIPFHFSDSLFKFQTLLSGLANIRKTVARTVDRGSRDLICMFGQNSNLIFLWCKKFKKFKNSENLENYWTFKTNKLQSSPDSNWQTHNENWRSLFGWPRSAFTMSINSSLKNSRASRCWALCGFCVAVGPTVLEPNCICTALDVQY